MDTVAGLILTLICIPVVAAAFGLAAAHWHEQLTAWGPRLLRGTAVTVGAALLLFAALDDLAAVLIP